MLPTSLLGAVDYESVNWNLENMSINNASSPIGQVTEEQTKHDFLWRVGGEVSQWLLKKKNTRKIAFICSCMVDHCKELFLKMY